jgi:hypothetical protein
LPPAAAILILATDEHGKTRINTYKDRDFDLIIQNSEVPKAYKKFFGGPGGGFSKKPPGRRGAKKNPSE